MKRRQESELVFISVIERFSFECRKVILVLRLLSYAIGLKNSRLFFIQ